jgi:putative SOS response-associated peptidase YedK
MTTEQLAAYTDTYPAAKMEARPVSMLVNNPRNDSPEILAEAD